MDMIAEGPLDRLIITGPLAVSNTHLAGYNLGSKLGALAALTGIRGSEDTVIQVFSSGLRVAPEGLRADNIVLEVPAIGSLSGKGVIGDGSRLDFQMLLKLSSTSGSLLGKLGGLTQTMQTKGIPFVIQGKTSNPLFLPAAGGLRNTLENALLPGTQDKPGNTHQPTGLKGIVDSFLKKKKPQ